MRSTTLLVRRKQENRIKNAFPHILYYTEQSRVLLHTSLFIAQSQGSLQPLRQSSSSF